MKISALRPLALLALSTCSLGAAMAAPPSAPKPGMGGKMGGPGMGGPGGGRMGGGMRGGGGMMMRMMKDLNLTSAQQAKLKPLMDQRRSIRQSTSLSEDQKKVKMTALTKSIDAVLTPAQKAKREKMMKEMRAKFQQGGGGGRMGGGMRGGPGMMGGKPRV